MDGSDVHDGCKVRMSRSSSKVSSPRNVHEERALGTVEWVPGKDGAEVMSNSRKKDFEVTELSLDSERVYPS